MIDFDEAHRLFRLSHAGVGAASLLAFWLPALSRKGSRLHVRSGRVFVWCAGYLGVTGLLASIWGVVHPASFLAESELTALDDRQRRAAFENIRFILSITGFLALGVMAGVVLGVRSVRVKHRHAELRSRPLLALEIGFAAWSTGLMAYGAAMLLAPHVGWETASGGSLRYVLSMALGAFGVYGAIGGLRYIYGPAPEPMAWWTMHMECMIGNGAGLHAAFFLFGAARIFDLQGSGQLLAALVPIVIGEAATAWLKRRRPGPSA